MSLRTEITTAMLAGLETTINTWLQLDPRTMQRLARLNGKVIAVELRGLDLQLCFLPGPKTLNLMLNYHGEADTVISGTPLALTGLMFGDGHRSLFSGEVRIEGDIELGQQFKRILDSMDIDWEEHLSQLTGDIVAHQAAQFLRSLLDWGQHSRQQLAHNLGEFLQQESATLASGDVLTQFHQDVDTLRDDTERLIARMQVLKQRLQPQQSS